jgi:hypothetical protein
LSLCPSYIEQVGTVINSHRLCAGFSQINVMSPIIVGGVGRVVDSLMGCDLLSCSRVEVWAIEENGYFAFRSR